MKKNLLTVLLAQSIFLAAGQIIPIDTSNWNIEAQSYVLETYKGKDAIYLQGGSITLKDAEFLNGTIEYDIYLKNETSYPGVYFRTQENGNAEQFYVRPHQAMRGDANQAIPTTKNITPWQLYHGPKYSFPYPYKYDDWTHVKIVVRDDQAQVFLDWSETPNLSWNTFNEVKTGGIILTGGNRSGMHLADIKVSNEVPEVRDFNAIQREITEGLIPHWSLSDKFSEELLTDLGNLEATIRERKWVGTVEVEEGTAANISRIHDRFDGSGANTALGKVVIDSNKEQVKLFEFGYSDRVMVILNGKPVYWGNNKFRSRDYRYLGTIGLFDAVYLDLKRGKNELILAVSEDFGGWLVTGRISDQSGIKSIK